MPPSNLFKFCLHVLPSFLLFHKGVCIFSDGGDDYDDDGDQVVTTLLGEWSQLLGSGRRLEEVCMWTTAVVDRFG